jgi:DNA repair protein RecO (recombination protein O)
MAPSGRRLPAAARDVISAWLRGDQPDLEPAAGRAHQRLLREFVTQHLPDSRELRAFAVWEQGGW